MRVALITGATSGIGLACARAFAAAGWEVQTTRGDVAEPSTSRDAVASALDRFGRLDAVVGNAGITLAKEVDETTEEELDRLIAVNLKALVYLAQAAHEPLRRTRGSLVVVASNKGLVAQRRSPIYVATKGAAIQLARALALDWAQEGIRVNAVCPGLVDTRMLERFVTALPDAERTRRELAAAQPLGRLAAPEEIAEVVLFLCSSGSSFITGVALPVDGGFTAQ